MKVTKGKEISIIREHIEKRAKRKKEKESKKKYYKWFFKNPDWKKCHAFKWIKLLGWKFLQVLSAIFNTSFNKNI